MIFKSSAVTKFGAFAPIWGSPDWFVAPNVRMTLTDDMATGFNAGLVARRYSERYDRIFANRGDSAVVELNGTVCRGCHMKVTPSCVTDAKIEKSLVPCSNCGRFVYYAELP